MSRPLLVVNAGSSSLKLALFGDDLETPLASALAERLNTADAKAAVKTSDTPVVPLPEYADHQTAVQSLVAVFRDRGWLPEAPRGIGHRVVHGGERFTASAAITPDVIAGIEDCVALAPLHNPTNLEGIRILQTLFPATPQVAVFDTAFHQSLPRHAYLYALPLEWYERHGVRRYGFHGISHRYILRQAAARLGKPIWETSLISAHLGNGCSVTAIDDGQSRDTSMGFTPLEGLVMGTRSGDIDPGLFDLFSRQGLKPAQISELLNQRSGLLGLSGLSNDMRTLVQAERDGVEAAKVAIDVFCFRLARYIGAMMSSLTHLDALVFTAGVGENSQEVRQRTLHHLALLGFHMDEEANADHGRRQNGAIHLPGSHPILVIPTNEESVIAQDTQDCLTQPTDSPRDNAIH